MTIQKRIERIETQLSSLGTPCPDFTGLSDDELATAIEEINQGIINELGETKGRAEIARVEAMSDEELERAIRL